MITDVRSLQSDHNIKPDAIFITGDLTYSGQKEEFDLFNKFLNELINVTELPLDRCFCVPGNHDVDRSQVSEEAKMFRNNLLLEKNNSQLEKLQSDSNIMKILLAPLDNFARFAVLPSRITYEKIFYIVKLILPGIPIDISILGLNSAWLSYDDCPPIVGRYQAQRALEEIDNKSFIIGLIHHPLSLLPEWDQISVTDILDYHCDYLLHGHYHRSRLENLGQSPYRCSRIATGGSFIGGRSLNGYNIVEVDFENGFVTAFFRLYRPDGGGEWVEDNIFRNPKPGQHQWNLSKRFALQLIPHKQEVTVQDLIFLNKDYIYREEEGYFEIIEEGERSYNKVKNIANEFTGSFNKHLEKVSKGLLDIQRAPNTRMKRIIFDQIAISMNTLAGEIVEKIPLYKEYTFKAVDSTCKAARMLKEVKSEEKNKSMNDAINFFASMQSIYSDLSRKISEFKIVLSNQISFTTQYAHSKNNLIKVLGQLLEEFKFSEELVVEAGRFIEGLIT